MALCACKRLLVTVNPHVILEVGGLLTCVVALVATPQFSLSTWWLRRMFCPGASGSLHFHVVVVVEFVQWCLAARLSVN